MTQGEERAEHKRWTPKDGVNYQLVLGGEPNPYEPIAWLYDGGSYHINLTLLAKCDPYQFDLFASQILRALIERGLTEMTGAIEPKETEHG